MSTDIELAERNVKLYNALADLLTAPSLNEDNLHPGDVILVTKAQEALAEDAKHDV